jgi:GNAT superfamily N-acetyltransferase
VFAAVVDGETIGFAAMFRRDDDGMELDGPFVDPSRRRRGFGAALIEHCAGVCRSLGARVLHVVGDLHAMDFYEACGFVKVGMGSTRFGLAERLERSM